MFDAAIITTVKGGHRSAHSFTVLHGPRGHVRDHGVGAPLTHSTSRTKSHLIAGHQSQAAATGNESRAETGMIIGDLDRYRGGIDLVERERAPAALQRAPPHAAARRTHRRRAEGIVLDRVANPIASARHESSEAAIRNAAPRNRRRRNLNKDKSSPARSTMRRRTRPGRRARNRIPIPTSRRRS
jgi:hypothetical protein